MHFDFDYFFAQCEEIRRPEIAYNPVVVCVFSGRTKDSGVVSTANYVARKYGVKSGIPINVAKAKLASIENSQFLPLDKEYYKFMSESALEVIKEYADVFEYVGLDECFIDVSRRVTGDFEVTQALARMIKNQVLEKTNLVCSVGIAPTKAIAKIASDYDKPNGLTVVRPQNVSSFLYTLDVGRIPGIGPKTHERLIQLGIKTAGELAEFDSFRLMDEFGKKTVASIQNAARGIDEDPVIGSLDGDRKLQIMRIITLPKDVQIANEMYADLRALCNDVYDKVRKRKVEFKSAGIILILDDLENITRSKVLKAHVSSLEVLHSTVRSLLNEAMSEKKRNVRRLGVRVTDLRNSFGQNTLFDYFSNSTAKKQG